MGKVWTEQEDSLILSEYKNKGASKLTADLPNRTRAAIYQRAVYLGLTKSDKVIEEVEKVEEKESKLTFLRVQELANSFERNNEDISNLIKWKDNLSILLDSVQIGDRINFGQGLFEKVDLGFYCKKGVASFISRDEMYVGMIYDKEEFISKVLDINRVLENWNREKYNCNVDVGYLYKLKQEYIKDEKESVIHRGRIEGSDEDKAKEAQLRIELQIDGYVENVVRKENYTEVYTVEGGSNHIRYLVYDAGDIYVK